MDITYEQLVSKLTHAGIFGPDSRELAIYEERLTRYFVKEFKRHIEKPSLLSDFGLSSDKGAIMERTVELMESHYDERPEFFESFLDNRYRAYSMAYYGATAEVIRSSNISLEEAQHAKFSLIAERAQIAGNERIFNIGCGFGSLETYLLNQYPGIEIVSITPSKVQIDYLKARMRDPANTLGGGRFTLLEGTFDYTELKDLGKNSYDLVISVAVFEQVINMRAMLQRIARLLVPAGRTFHHFITSRQIIPQLLDPKKTRIGLYFPGGRVWPHDELARHTEYFNLAGAWFINGLNYWRTLDVWHRRFWSRLPELYGPIFDLDRLAHWNNYFSLCKAVFAPLNGTFYGNSHYLFKLKQ
jgi:cyclopropane-fatty-acyl-phospholipid synthase